MFFFLLKISSLLAKAIRRFLRYSLFLMRLFASLSWFVLGLLVASNSGFNSCFLSCLVELGEESHLSFDELRALPLIVALVCAPLRASASFARAALSDV